MSNSGLIPVVLLKKHDNKNLKAITDATHNAMYTKTFPDLSKCGEGELEEKGEAGNQTEASFSHCLQVLEDEKPHL